MARNVFSPVLTEMIERAKNLTSDQADALGTTWTSQEGLSNDPASLGSGYSYKREIPRIQNPALQFAWQRVSSVASEQGRADELDAAIAAEKAVERAVRRFKIGRIPKAGAVEAARAAVLAVGVRDLIDDKAYELLVGPWQQVFGTL
jgi:hypothetical protein